LEKHVGEFDIDGVRKLVFWKDFGSKVLYRGYALTKLVYHTGK
jgi:hypothetical protein